MCEVGMRVVVQGRRGMTIGHTGRTHAVVSWDDTSEVDLVPESQIRIQSGSVAKPVVVMPSGRAHPLTRDWPRARTRRR